jgi:hypothetical protein
MTGTSIPQLLVPTTGVDNSLVSVSTIKPGSSPKPPTHRTPARLRERPPGLLQVVRSVRRATTARDSADCGLICHGLGTGIKTCDGAASPRSNRFQPPREQPRQPCKP